LTTGEKIKSARLAKGLTQEDLGSLIGVQKAAINKYENGSVVNFKRTVLAKLAAALDVSPVYLLNYDDDSPEYSADELTLLAAYRAADDRARQDALNTLLSHPAKPKEKTEAG
jgi:transcriptional regulator with XRE-family HTH domain